MLPKHCHPRQGPRNPFGPRGQVGSHVDQLDSSRLAEVPPRSRGQRGRRLDRPPRSGRRCHPHRPDPAPDPEGYGPDLPRLWRTAQLGMEHRIRGRQPGLRPDRPTGQRCPPGTPQQGNGLSRERIPAYLIRWGCRYPKASGRCPQRTRVPPPNSPGPGGCAGGQPTRGWPMCARPQGRTRPGSPGGSSGPNQTSVPAVFPAAGQVLQESLCVVGEGSVLDAVPDDFQMPARPNPDDGRRA